jgi:hypothetical protein
MNSLVLDRSGLSFDDRNNFRPLQTTFAHRSHENPMDNAKINAT